MLYLIANPYNTKLKRLDKNQVILVGDFIDELENENGETEKNNVEL
jgi:hypothetical protein